MDKDAPCDVHSPLDQARITELFNKSPRYATLVDFDTTNNDGIASKC